jgi:hypothetical protein
MRITNIDIRAMKVAKLAVKREAEASTVEGAAVSSDVEVEVRVSSRDLVWLSLSSSPEVVAVEVAVAAPEASVSVVSVAAAPDSVSVSVASALSERVALIVVAVVAPELPVSEAVSEPSVSVATPPSVSVAASESVLEESVSTPLVWAVLEPVSVMVETTSVSEESSRDDVTVTKTLLVVKGKVVDSPAAEFSDPSVDVSSAAVSVSVASGLSVVSALCSASSADVVGCDVSDDDPAAVKVGSESCVEAASVEAASESSVVTGTLEVGSGWSVVLSSCAEVGSGASSVDCGSAALLDSGSDSSAVVMAANPPEVASTWLSVSTSGVPVTWDSGPGAAVVALVVSLPSQNSVNCWNWGTT